MLALAAVVAFGVASVADVPSPRPSGWVSDQAQVLDEQTRERINGVAEELHASRRIELAVVTVDDVSGTPKQFASELFRAWGIGSAETNNGVLVLLVIGKRRIEVETGTGIEAALTAEWLSSMQAETMVPRFKTGDFGGGLLAGVQAINDQIRRAPVESTSATPPGEYRSNPASEKAIRSDAGTESKADPRWGFLVGAGVGALGIALAGAITTAIRRRRTCTACAPPRPMIKLDEVADDAYLDSGQRAEERIGSVNYIVLLCPGCGTTRTRRKRPWAPHYQSCPSCNYKTHRSTTATRKAATYSAPGEIEITNACSHCDHIERHRYATPKLISVLSSSPSSATYSSRSSSSSSGSFSWFDSDTSSSDSDDSDSSDSSSGFSGGSSRGGGAGSSW